MKCINKRVNVKCHKKNKTLLFLYIYTYVYAITCIYALPTLRTRRLVELLLGKIKVEDEDEDKDEDICM